MIVEIYDSTGGVYRITSDKPEIVGAWFAEHAEKLQTGDTRLLPYRINVWPSGDFNSAEAAEWLTAKTVLTAGRLRWLASRFADWREEDSV